MRKAFLSVRERSPSLSLSYFGPSLAKNIRAFQAKPAPEHIKLSIGIGTIITNKNAGIHSN